MLSKINQIFPKEIIDPVLGKVIFKMNPRAHHFYARPYSDCIYITIPLGATKENLENAMKEFRTKLPQMKRSSSHKPIDLSFKIQTDLLHIGLETGNQNKFFSNNRLIVPMPTNGKNGFNANSEASFCMLMQEPQTLFIPGQSKIICPPNTYFNSEKMQNWLHKVIEGTLRKQAKNYLPERLSQLSQFNELPFCGITVKSNQSNWGSCSIRKHINLSFYLMTLPPHLIDYVLLHELCHTREMNHGERFWALLNSLTNNQAHPLRKELRKYHTSF